MKTRYGMQSLFIRKSVQVLLIVALFLIMTHSTQATFAKASVQQVQSNNIALTGTASQSSDFYDNICTRDKGGGEAWKAIDGNPNGDWNGCSVTHTEKNNRASWHLNLGQPHQISTIRIFNRTDCCSDRLSNFVVSVSNNGTSWQNFPFPGTASNKENFAINTEAQYVQIQLLGENFLSLAEVEVFEGPPADFTVSVYENAPEFVNDVVTIKQGETKSFNVGQITTSGTMNAYFSASSTTASSYEWKVTNKTTGAVVARNTNREFSLTSLAPGEYETVLTTDDNGQTSSGRSTLKIVPRNGGNVPLNLSWAFINNTGWHFGTPSSHDGDDKYSQDWNWGGRATTEDYGMVLLSPTAGKVVYKGLTSAGYGNAVSILLDDTGVDNNPGDFVVLLAHLDKIWDGLNVGDTVCPGTPIGQIGKSGTKKIVPHAHISAWQGVFQLNSSGLPGFAKIKAGNAPQGTNSNGPTFFATTFNIVNDFGFQPQGCEGAPFVVEGIVLKKNGDRMPGVDIRLEDNAGNPIPQVQPYSAYGLYVFPNIQPGTYKVVPTKLGCTFTPPERQFTVTTRHIYVDPFQATGAKGCN